MTSWREVMGSQDYHHSVQKTYSGKVTEGILAVGRVVWVISKNVLWEVILPPPPLAVKGLIIVLYIISMVFYRPSSSTCLRSSGTDWTARPEWTRTTSSPLRMRCHVSRRRRTTTTSCWRWPIRWTGFCRVATTASGTDATSGASHPPSAVDSSAGGDYNSTILYRIPWRPLPNTHALWSVLDLWENQRGSAMYFWLNFDYISGGSTFSPER